MPEVDVLGVFGTRCLDVTQDVGAFFGVDPAQPLVWSVGDVVLVTADERDPSRGKMDPVRRQIPFPQCLAVQASAGSTLFHSLDEGSPLQLVGPKA
jgi:hypothetical protein